MAKWSWSKLQTARECPFAVHLEHVQKAPKAIPDYLHAGRANHSVMEEASRRCFLGRIPEPPEVVAEQMREEHQQGSWPKANVKIFDRLPECIGASPIPQRGEEMILEKKFLVDGVGMLEESGTKSGDAFCSGLADHVVVGSDRLVVWDWKTGWGSGKYVDIDQVILYAGMVCAWLDDQGRQLPPNIEVAIKHVFRPSNDVDLVLTPDSLADRYRFIIEELRSLNYIFDNPEPPKAHFGDHCARCFVSASCPVYQEQIQDPSIWDGPKEAWAMREVLKKELARIEDFLKRELAANPQVDVGGGQYLRFHTSQIHSIDAAAAYDLLREKGVTNAVFLANLTLSKTKLFKMVKQKADRAEIMLAASYVSGERSTMTTDPSPDDDE
jgi:hypothetical protein